MNVAGSKTHLSKQFQEKNSQGRLCRLDVQLFSNLLTITLLHFLENCALHLFCVNTVIAITFLLLCQLQASSYLLAQLKSGIELKMLLGCIAGKKEDTTTCLNSKHCSYRKKKKIQAKLQLCVNAVCIIQYHSPIKDRCLL